MDYRPGPARLPPVKKKELYRLPTFGRMEYRGLVFQGFGLYLIFLGIVSWFFTQHFAHQLGYHPDLGDPWIQHPAQAERYLLLMAAGSCREPSSLPHRSSPPPL